jgi:hypothetical protein
MGNVGIPRGGLGVEKDLIVCRRMRIGISREGI